jgi:YtkA-like
MSLITGHINGGRQAAAPLFCGVILALACLVVTTACRRAENTAPGITVKEDITPRPARVGPATVAIDLADSSQNAVSHAAIMVEADMSHPGMSPVFVEAKETTPGRYRAPIEFSMGGDWVVLLHIKLADGRRIERQMDVRGVRTN